MKITIIAVGKIKEKFLINGIDEYIKRISRFAKLEIIEVKDEKVPDKTNKIQNDKIKDIEAGRIISRMDNSAYKILLDLKGEKYNSQELSQHLNSQFLNGKSHIIFVIGGSIGVGKKIYSMSNLKLSFSEMTFPHQLMRLILLEQIYRSFKIINNETYHK